MKADETNSCKASRKMGLPTAPMNSNARRCGAPTANRRTCKKNHRGPGESELRRRVARGVALAGASLEMSHACVVGCRTHGASFAKGLRADGFFEDVAGLTGPSQAWPVSRASPRDSAGAGGGVEMPQVGRRARAPREARTGSALTKRKTGRRIDPLSCEWAREVAPVERVNQATAAAGAEIFGRASACSFTFTLTRRETPDSCMVTP